MALAARELAGLDSGAALTSIRLTGAVTRHIGETETGTAVLEAAGPDKSRIEFDFPGGSRIELRGDDAHGTPWGAWIANQPGDANPAHAMALANCWIPAAWFVPQFAVLMPGHADEEVSELAAANGRRYLRRIRKLPGQAAAITATIAGRSAATMDLDSATGVPVALHYTLWPDDGAVRDVPVEVRYSGYQRVDGTEIPFHIQWSMNGALDYDIEISAAEVNPDLDPADFAEPAVVTAFYATPPRPRGGNAGGAR